MSDSPSTAARKIKAPTDHKSPAQAEVEGGTSPITLGDTSFEIPSDIDEIDSEFLKYAADGDSYRMVYAVLSVKDGHRFKALHPTIGDLKAVAKQIAEVYGFDSAGE